MKRYLAIFFANAKFCLLRILEFRAEVISWSVFNIGWLVLALVGVNLIFGQVQTIAGWDKNEVLILVMIAQLFDCVLGFFIFPSIVNFAGTIRKGNLDFILLKPINARFMASFSRFEYDNYLRFFVLLAVLAGYLKNTHIPITFAAIAYSIVLFILSLFIFYCLFFIVAIFSFWLINFFNIDDFLDSILGVGRFPTKIFNRELGFLFTYIVPVAFVATFPTQALFGKAGIELLFFGLLIAGVMYLASHWFWNFALKHYSSASS